MNTFRLKGPSLFLCKFYLEIYRVESPYNSNIFRNAITNVYEGLATIKTRLHHSEGPTPPTAFSVPKINKKLKVWRRRRRGEEGEEGENVC